MLAFLHQLLQNASMEKFIFTRDLHIPEKSFFLFGPRGVGKSHFLKKNMPENAIQIDLLESELYLTLSRNPGLLESICGNLPKNSWVWIDEVQKVSSLLDEVHRLIEKKGWRFALSGSSARKLKRGGGNLLAGRALTRNMESFTSKELDSSFSLELALEFGTLPLVIKDPKYRIDTLSTYVTTYIKEEIKEEGLVRKAEPFLRFLEIAGIVNGEQINSLNIARDAKIPRSNVDNYFSILEDTLLGHWLPPYKIKAKVREQSHPKFYWFDAGVARASAGLLREHPESIWLGKSLETLIFHELRVYNHISSKEKPIYFYRSDGQSEIDFILEVKKGTTHSIPEIIAIEVKYSKKWDNRWEKPMRSLAESGKVKMKKMIGIYMGKEEYFFEGVEVVNIHTFLKSLHAGLIY